MTCTNAGHCLTNHPGIKLSVAAPAFNEGDGIKAVVSNWYAFLSQHKDLATFEIVICNDGSSDNTGTALDELAFTHSEILALHFKKNQGAAAALSAAISATQFDWVLLIDSDDQFPIENFSIMLDTLRQSNVSAIMGIRNKQDNLFARAGSKASGMICNLIHSSQLKDFNSAFKLVNGPLLRSLNLEAKGMNYSTEITSRLLECKAAIAEVDIVHRQRNIGKSKMKWIKGSIHRFLFVTYIFMRQLLLKFGILKSPVNIS